MVAVSESTDKLRQEWDRFVGFAFANADALIEIDQSLKPRLSARTAVLELHPAQ